MSEIKIIADSTCDLSEEIKKKYDIRTIPLMITMENETGKDGIDVHPDDIYHWSDETGETPKTAAPLLGDAVEFLSPFVKAEQYILYFGISEAMSGTCNVMRLAAESLEYEKMTVIDSQNLSTGIGIQVIRAAELAAMGYSVEEIIADNEAIRSKVRASFVVDTLTFLYRGGRCSAVTALLANTIRLKPKIVVANGKMGVHKKYRGNQKSVILKYVTELGNDLKNADARRVFITHSGCSEDLISEIYNKLEELQIFEEILVTKAGGVISSHCGPNTLGVLFISK